MSPRPILTLAKATKPTHPPFSMVKKAIRLFKGRGVPQEVYRRNALAWLASMAALGDRHLLKGGHPRWGIAGEPGSVSQIFAPRRQGKV